MFGKYTSVMWPTMPQQHVTFMYLALCMQLQDIYNIFLSTRVDILQLRNSIYHTMSYVCAVVITNLFATLFH